MTSIVNLGPGALVRVRSVGVCWKGDDWNLGPEFWAAMVLFSSSTFPQKMRGDSREKGGVIEKM